MATLNLATASARHLITKSGTEEIDTQTSEAVFIYEGATSKNALIEQAIARACRYKSHYFIPKN